MPYEQVLLPRAEKGRRAQRSKWLRTSSSGEQRRRSAATSWGGSERALTTQCLELVAPLGPLKSAHKGGKREQELPGRPTKLSSQRLASLHKESDSHTPMQITVRTVIFPNKINRLQWPAAISQTTLTLPLKFFQSNAFEIFFSLGHSKLYNVSEFHDPEQAIYLSSLHFFVCQIRTTKQLHKAVTRIKGGRV